MNKRRGFGLFASLMVTVLTGVCAFETGPATSPSPQSVNDAIASSSSPTSDPKQSATDSPTPEATTPESTGGTGASPQNINVTKPSNAAEVLKNAPDNGAVTITTVSMDPANPQAAPTLTDKTFPSKEAAQEYTEQQLAKEDTASVEVPSEITAFAIPSDPQAAQQYQHETTHLDTVNAWKYSQGAGITVAVIDSGVDGTHPDLKGRVLKGRDFSTPYVGQAGSDGWNDDVGHGTHVAGILAASANNGIGGAGIAPKVNVLPVKVLGSTASNTTTQLARAIIWSVDQGAKVINMSLGGGYSAAEDAAVQYAISRDVVVVAAVGNTGKADNVNTLKYPAALPNVTSVAAIDKNSQRASYSSTNGWVDVSAPGDAILSTEPNNRYGLMSGTSMATPMVAGVAALVRAANPSLKQSQVRAAIAATARDIGAAGRDDATGYGEVNAYAAVYAARTGSIPTLTKPSISINAKPAAQAAAADTSFSAMSIGALGNGSHVLGLYEDGTSPWYLIDIASGTGTAQWSSTLRGKGKTANYYIAFPGDDLHAASVAGPYKVTYGTRSVKPVTLSMTSVQKTTSCPTTYYDSNICYKVSLRASTTDGSSAVGTMQVQAGRQLDGRMETGTLSPSGTSWTGTIWYQDNDTSGSDYVFSAFVPAQNLNATYQIAKAAASTVTVQGSANAAVKTTMNISYTVTGATTSVNNMVRSVSIYTGDCYTVNATMKRNDGINASGTRTLGVYDTMAMYAASDSYLAKQYPPYKITATAKNGAWTGSVKICPKDYTARSELRVIYAGNSSEASTTSVDVLSLGMTKRLTSSLTGMKGTGSLTYGKTGTYSATLKVNGKVKGGAKVSFCRSDATTSRLCATVTTNSKGVVSAKTSPARNASFWFEYSATGVASAKTGKVSTKVAFRLVAKSPKKGKFAVQCDPRNDRGKVTIQRYNASTRKWVTVRTFTNPKTGHFTITVKSGYKHRAVYAATKQHAGATVTINIR